MIDVFEHAIEGIRTAFREERNMKCHIAALIAVTLLGFFTGLLAMEWALLVFCFGLVIGAEMINTAIERTAKDIAAVAVLVAAMVSVVVGTLIFIPHFFG